MRKIIRPDKMPDEQRMAFVEEVERQGCHVRCAPLHQVAVLHGSRRRAVLTYEAWTPQIRKAGQVDTLWPRPFPPSWFENGLPTQTITRPVPHPERLLAILTKETQD